jgi:hypothetical protein
MCESLKSAGMPERRLLGRFTLLATAGLLFTLALSGQALACRLPSSQQYLYWPQLPESIGVDEVVIRGSQADPADVLVPRPFIRSDIRPHPDTSPFALGAIRLRVMEVVQGRLPLDEIFVVTVLSDCTRVSVNDGRVDDQFIVGRVVEGSDGTLYILARAMPYSDISR